MIGAPPADGPKWLLADWIELVAVSSKAGSASVHEINTDPLLGPEHEPDGIPEEDLLKEGRLLRLTAEIEKRREIMGDSYPFVLSSDGGTLSLNCTDSVGANVYLFCLFASHGRSGGFLNGSETVPMGPVPDLMQACGTWSAAGYEHGPSYALGLDPAAETFLPKLKEIYSAFGDGKVVDTIPAGAPKQVKDDGIDVIAWKHMPDKNPPADYLLCQIASGRNWVDKSAVAAAGRFHATWFAPAPARRGKPAMVIPFCVEVGTDDDPDTEQEVLAMHWRRVIAEYGEFFYRYRVPKFAAEGIGLIDAGIHVDMADWQPELKEFVGGVIERLRAP